MTGGGSSHDLPAVVVGLGMTGLGVVRSLAAHGVPLIGIDKQPPKTSAHTRLCRKLFVDTGERSLWDALAELGRALERMGYPIRTREDVGNVLVAGIDPETGEISGAADPRRYGAAARAPAAGAPW